MLGCTQASTKDAVRPRREVLLAFALETDDWAERMRTLAPFAFAPGVGPQLLLTHDAVDRLAAIGQPTLAITGAQDQIIPAESSEVLCFDGAGHLFFIEAPERTLDVLDAFLN